MDLLRWRLLMRALAILCVLLLAPGDALAYEQSEPALYSSGSNDPEDETKLAPQQLDSLVAPIALYPDPLLAQILAASTYPLQITQASQWLQAYSKWKTDKLTKEAAKQDWDPSIQALVVFPSVRRQMDQNLQWTTGLGNAFLAQQADVMAAVQDMRQKGKRHGVP